MLQEAKDLTREFVYVCLYTCLCEEVIEMTLVNFETESPVDRWMERENGKMRFYLWISLMRNLKTVMGMFARHQSSKSNI